VLELGLGVMRFLENGKCTPGCVFFWVLVMPQEILKGSFPKLVLVELEDVLIVAEFICPKALVLNLKKKKKKKKKRPWLMKGEKETKKRKKEPIEEFKA